MDPRIARAFLADSGFPLEPQVAFPATTCPGGEGMVVKPFDFLARGRKGLVHPAVKVRGPE